MIQNRIQSYLHRIAIVKLIFAKKYFDAREEKKMLKGHPPDSDQAIKICRRTTLIEKQLKELCDEVVDAFTYEYSYQRSEEIKEDIRNATSLTSILK